MKFMIKAAIISLLVATLCMLCVAFVAWDVSAFDLSGWDPVERFFMLIVSLFFGVGIVEVTG